MGILSTDEDMKADFKNELLTIKSETINEFIDKFEKRCVAGGIYPAFVKRQLENTKKEMLGE